jgi:hypothetical protein
VPAGIELDSYCGEAKYVTQVHIVLFPNRMDHGDMGMGAMMCGKDISKDIARCGKMFWHIRV